MKIVILLDFKDSHNISLKFNLSLASSESHLWISKFLWINFDFIFRHRRTPIISTHCTVIKNVLYLVCKLLEIFSSKSCQV